MMLSATTTTRPADQSRRRIVLLPSDVQARLRSSLTITTLAQAISELVQNSLDANARTIRIQINNTRNSCVVEDDGCGIAPEDLPILGTRYATSKYTPGTKPSTFGHLGITLASLATDSVLTLLTRASTHRSTWIARFSYSSTPVPTGHAPDHLRLQHPGTIVRVEGLFGNMPVRVKAHQASLDEEREWEGLKRMLAALLLSDSNRKSIKQVSITLRDASGRKLVIKPRSGDEAGHEDDEAGHEDDDDSAMGESMPEIRLLHQFYSFREIGPSSTWERVRARRGPVSINGWISTVGSPSRRYQFISINSHPLLPPPQSTNVLHATFNKLFSQSTFGTVIDNPEDKQTKKANKPRRGVDRFPKCILRLECHREWDDLSTDEVVLVGGEGGTGDASSGKGGMEGENLRVCVELLQKLTEQFLKVHHFRPRGGDWGLHRLDTDAEDMEEEQAVGEDLEGEGNDKNEEDGQEADAGHSDKTLTAAVVRPSSSTRRRKRNVHSPLRQSRSPRPSSASSSATGKRSTLLSRETSSLTPQLADLEGWGNKIKSARKNPRGEEGRRIAGFPKQIPSTPTTLEKTPIIIIDDDDEEEGGQEMEHSAVDDGIIQWRNPLTKRVAQVDLRTGNTRVVSAGNSEGLRRSSRPGKHRLTLSRNSTAEGSSPGFFSSKRPKSDISSTVTIHPPTSSTSTMPVIIDLTTSTSPDPASDTDPKPSTFITSGLTAWKNPVFPAPSEPPIPAIGPNHALATLQHHVCSSHYFTNATKEAGVSLGEMLGLGTERLSKEGLRQARVIGQVDRKFVLVVVKTGRQKGGVGGEESGELLVVIDQHAADERWRVEAFWDELCREVTPPAVTTGETGSTPSLPPVHDGESEGGTGEGEDDVLFFHPPRGIAIPSANSSSTTPSVLSRTTTFPIPPNKPPLKYPITVTESSLLNQHQYMKVFADWGILYTTWPSCPSKSEPTSAHTITITHLPRLILHRVLAERYLGIELIRGHLWYIYEHRLPPSPPTDWTIRLPHAPQKLVELLNSRACRSAVMFGDELGGEECLALVRKLGGCRFPFMCAHGRPSMVPLLRVLGAGGTTTGDAGGGVGREVSNGRLGGEYTFSSLGIRSLGVGGGGWGGGWVGGGGKSVPGTGIGERMYARVGGEGGKGKGKGKGKGEGGVGYMEAFRRWKRELETAMDDEAEEE